MLGCGAFAVRASRHGTAPGGRVVRDAALGDAAFGVHGLR